MKADVERMAATDSTLLGLDFGELPPLLDILPALMLFRDFKRRPYVWKPTIGSSFTSWAVRLAVPHFAAFV